MISETISSLNHLVRDCRSERNISAMKYSWGGIAVKDQSMTQVFLKLIQQSVTAAGRQRSIAALKKCLSVDEGQWLLRVAVDFQHENIMSRANHLLD